MLRVTLCCVHPGTEWSGKISGLQFNSNPDGEAQASVTGISRLQGKGHKGLGTITIPTVLRGVDIDLEARDIESDMDAAAQKENLEWIPDSTDEVAVEQSM